MLNFFHKKINNKKGFTLVELIIVVAILGILAAIAIPRFGNASVTARTNADKATAKTLADATALAIAEGKVTVSTSADTDVPLADLVTNGYMNSVPVPQLNGNTAFIVTVKKTTGIIEVRYNSATGTIVYP